MKNSFNIDMLMCETFGELFKYVVEEDINLNWFIKAFMKSDCCSRYFDCIHSHIQIAEPKLCFSYFQEECKDIIYSNNQKTASEAFNLGYYYRKLFLHTNILSAELYDIISPDDLLACLESMQELNEEDIIDKICKLYNLEEREFVDIIDRE